MTPKPSAAWLSVLLMFCVLAACGPGRAVELTPPPRVTRFVDQLRDALRDSCAGRSVLEGLSRPRAAGRDAGLQMLAFEVSTAVQDATGQLVDPSDPALVAAARELRRLPSSYKCEPVLAVMIVIDEWTVRAASREGTVARLTTLVDSLRHSAPRDPKRLEPWLERTHPLLLERARKVIAFLT